MYNDHEACKILCVFQEHVLFRKRDLVTLFTEVANEFTEPCVQWPVAEVMCILVFSRKCQSSMVSIILSGFLKKKKKKGSLV